MRRTAFSSAGWSRKIAGRIIQAHTLARQQAGCWASGKQVFLVRFATLSRDRVSDSISDCTINGPDIESRSQLNDPPVRRSLHRPPRSSPSILQRMFSLNLIAELEDLKLDAAQRPSLVASRVARFKSKCSPRGTETFEKAASEIDCRL